MKATVDLPEDLLRAAKRLAVDQRTTLRALVEAGLRRELAERAGPVEPWRVPVWNGASGMVSQVELDAEIRRAREGRSFPEFDETDDRDFDRFPGLTAHNPLG